MLSRKKHDLFFGRRNGVTAFAPSPYFIVTIFTPSTLSVLRNTSPHHAKLCQTREAKFSGSYEKRCFRTKKIETGKKISVSLSLSLSAIGLWVRYPSPSPLFHDNNKSQKVFWVSGVVVAFSPGWSRRRCVKLPCRDAPLSFNHFPLTATGEKIAFLPPPSPFLYIDGMLFRCRRTLQPQNFRLKCAGQKIGFAGQNAAGGGKNFFVFVSSSFQRPIVCKLWPHFGLFPVNQAR